MDGQRHFSVVFGGESDEVYDTNMQSTSSTMEGTSESVKPPDLLQIGLLFNADAAEDQSEDDGKACGKDHAPL